MNVKFNLIKPTAYKTAKLALLTSLFGIALFPTTLTSAQSNKKEITLVTYAVTKAAYDKIIPLFVEQWKKDNKGEEVTIRTSYGGSGSQTRAVLDGLEADVVGLALALDTKKLEKAGLIDAGWEKELPNGAIVTKSVIALVTRGGNPKQVRNWSDFNTVRITIKQY